MILSQYSAKSSKPSTEPRDWSSANLSRAKMYTTHYMEHICPICGRNKLIADHRQHVYKIHNDYFCSYTCYRKAQKILESRLKQTNHGFR